MTNPQSPEPNENDWVEILVTVIDEMMADYLVKFRSGPELVPKSVVDRKSPAVLNQGTEGLLRLTSDWVNCLTESTETRGPPLTRG